VTQANSQDSHFSATHPPPTFQPRAITINSETLSQDFDENWMINSIEGSRQIEQY